MIDSALFSVIFSSVIGLIVTIVGFLIKRAVTQSDERATERQAEVHKQTDAIQATLKSILVEARDTNHRITKLEAWQIYERGQQNPKQGA